MGRRGCQPGERRRVQPALRRGPGRGGDPWRLVEQPDDRPALDAALLAGRTLRECAPGSPARKAIAGLAARLAATLPVR